MSALFVETKPFCFGKSTLNPKSAYNKINITGGIY
jgi:hypothetical protein